MIQTNNPVRYSLTEMQLDEFSNDNSTINELESYRQKFIDVHRKWFPHCYEDQMSDAYTDAIIIFYSNVKSGKLQTLKASAKTYVFAVAKNLLRNENRTFSKFTPLTIDISSEQETIMQEEKDEAEAKERILHEAISELGPRARQFLNLLLIQAITITDIAKIMHFSSTRSASTAKHKFITKLKRLAAKKYKEWERNERDL